VTPDQYVHAMDESVCGGGPQTLAIAQETEA
jgi:hypothetical protein